MMSFRIRNTNRKAVAKFAPIAGLVVQAVFICTCRSKTQSPSADFFPQSNAVEGWTKTGATHKFPADHLYEYIDGDADKYVQAGVVETRTADYVFGGKIEAVVDVFVMSNSAGAAKVFDAEQASDSQPAQVGDAARLYRGSLTFRKGRYFVRLVAYQDAPQLPDALTAPGRSIAGKL